MEEKWKIDFTADESGGKAATASFPPLGVEEIWKAHFTAGENGGKAAIAGFPPARTAVKLQLPVFLLLEWRKSGKYEFTAHASSGKAAWVSE